MQSILAVRPAACSAPAGASSPLARFARGACLRIALLCLLLAAARPASAQGVGIAGYWDGAAPHVRLFTAGANGRLLANGWDGATWRFEDHGSPPGANTNSAPATITYRDNGGEKIDAFVTGSNGRLYTRWWDGGAWRWTDLGQPAPDVKLICSPAAIEFENRGVPIINVFVTGDNGHLYVRWWDGRQWLWSDQGLPGPTAPAGVVRASSTPGVVTYMENEVRRIAAFVVGDDGRLYRDQWDGSAWQWSDHGAPPQASLISTPSVLATTENGVEQINAFVTADDGRLYTQWWDGSQWSWADLGSPEAAPLSTSPAAVAADVAGATNLNVFVVGQDQHLYTRWWDGSQWQWADLAGGVDRLIAATALQGTAGRLFMFAAFTRADGRVYVDTWDGANWQVSDANTPAGGVPLLPALSFLITDVSPDTAPAPSLLDPRNRTATGGKTVSIVVSPVVAAGGQETVYAAAEYSGIWKSTDSAATWRQAGRGLTTGWSAPRSRGLAIDDLAPDRLLYVTLDDDSRSGDARLGGAYSGGLWFTVDAAEHWRHADLPGCPQPDLRAVGFGAGRAYVLSGRCATLFTSTDLATWVRLPLPPGARVGTISVHGQTVFACDGSANVYRGVQGSGGFRWDPAYVLPNGNGCASVTVLPTERPVSPAALVIYANAGLAELALVNVETRAAPIELNFSAHQLMLHGTEPVTCCGEQTIFAARRAGSRPERFDVIFQNKLQYFELTTGVTVNTVTTPAYWIRPGFVDSRGTRLIHDDTWAVAFSSGYDGVSRCGAYIVTDGGISRRPGCGPFSWVTANTGYHAFNTQYLGGVAQGYCRETAGYSHPCAALYAPSGHNGTWYSLSGGLPASADPVAPWASLVGGDNGFAGIDPSDPTLLHIDRTAFKAGPGRAPDRSAATYSLYTDEERNEDFISRDEPQFPPLDPLHPVWRLPGSGDAMRPYGDYLSIARSKEAGYDTVERGIGVHDATGTHVVWRDISLGTHFPLATVQTVVSSGGQTRTVLYLLKRISAADPNHAQVLRGEVSRKSGAVPSWQDRSVVGPGCPSNAVALDNPVHIQLHPYVPDLAYVVDAGTRQIKYTTNGGECWFVDAQLTALATNEGEFRFGCEGSIGGGNLRCALQQMLFPTDDGRVRIAILFSGVVALNRDWGTPWVVISDRLTSEPGLPDIRRLTDLVSYPMSGFFDPNGVGFRGRPVGGSLYLGMLGRGVVRIDVTRP